MTDNNSCENIKCSLSSKNFQSKISNYPISLLFFWKVDAYAGISGKEKRRKYLFYGTKEITTCSET